MRMRIVRRPFASRHFVAPNVIAKLRADEDAGLGKREEVPVDGRSIERVMRQALRQLAMAYRRIDGVELSQNHHPLIGEPEALLDEESAEPLISRIGDRHLPKVYPKNQPRSRHQPEWVGRTAKRDPQTLEHFHKFFKDLGYLAAA